MHRAVVKNNVFSQEEQLLENIGRARDVKVGTDGFLFMLKERINRQSSSCKDFISAKEAARRKDQILRNQ